MGLKSMREYGRPDYSDDEAIQLREEEERRGALAHPQEFQESISYAKERFLNMFRGYVNDELPLMKPERQFVFKRTGTGNELMIFKDKIMGLDNIKAPEKLRQENIDKRHPASLGTHIRGLTLLREIDEKQLGDTLRQVRSKLESQGYSADSVDAKSIRRLIYTTTLVHEWVHGIDKYFTKFLNTSLTEPIAYWFEYNTMTTNVSPVEKALYDAVYETHFNRGQEGVKYMQEEPWFFEQVGGIDRIKQIMTTGKVNAKEARLFLHLAVNTPSAAL